MSDTKHTPEPWRIQLDDDEEPTQAYIRAIEADDELVAIVYSQADARLIAAAPDLLEALEEMLSTGLNGGNNLRLAFMAPSQQVLDEGALQDAEKSEAAVTKARAALNKAKGEL
jgi:hypothetical protein